MNNEIESPQDEPVLPVAVSETGMQMSRRGFLKLTAGLGLRLAAGSVPIPPQNSNARGLDISPQSEDATENLNAPETWSSFLEDRCNLLNSSINGSYKLFKDEFGFSGSDFDIRDSKNGGMYKSMYANLAYYAQNPDLLSSDCLNPDDYKAHFSGNGLDFSQNDQYNNSSPIFYDESSGSEFADDCKPFIQKIYDAFTSNQKVRGRHLVLSAESKTKVESGIAYFNCSDVPDSYRFEQWLHELAHQLGEPFVKRVYLDKDDMDGKKFVTAGHTFPKTADYYKKVCRAFAENLDFVNDRFFTRTGDTTKGMIESMGGLGMLYATGEFMAMLIEQTLTEGNPESADTFENLPDDIKKIVLFGFDQIVNGNDANGSFSESDLDTLKQKISEVQKDLPLEKIYLPTVTK